MAFKNEFALIFPNLCSFCKSGSQMSVPQFNRNRKDSAMLHFSFLNKIWVVMIHSKISVVIFYLNII